MGCQAGGAGQGGPSADGPALVSRRRCSGSSRLRPVEAPLPSEEDGARHARMGTGILPTSGESFGGESATSVGEEVRPGWRGGGGREDEEEAPPEEREVVGGWLGGLGFWVEAPMG